MHILIIPVEPGLHQYHGPFEVQEEAEEYARNNGIEIYETQELTLLSRPDGYNPAINAGVMDATNFFAKMYWEGSFNQMARYGLQPEEISDHQIRNLWSQYIVIHRDLSLIEDKLLEIQRSKGLILK